MTEQKKAAGNDILQTGKILIVGVIVLAALYFGATGIMQRFYSDNSAVQLTTYSSDRLGVEILRPEQWQQQESGENDPVKVVSFSKQPDPQADPSTQFSGQLLVDVQEAPSDAQKVEEDTFFSMLDENVNSSLGKPEGALPNEEYAELGSREEIEVDGFRALKVVVNITNYDGIEGELGSGVILFIYVSDAKQATVLYEGHSSDSAILDSFDRIIESVDIAE